MLTLLLQIGEMRFALDAREVIEVLPLVEVKPAPGLPEGVAGMMNYRGEPVPVIDLSRMGCGQPAPRLFSTRILLVRSPGPAGERPERTPSCIGVLAERATETRRFSEAAFALAPAAGGLAGFASAAMTDGNDLIFKLDLVQLFRRLAWAPPSSRDAQPLAWTSTPSPSF